MNDMFDPELKNRLKESVLKEPEFLGNTDRLLESWQRSKAAIGTPSNVRQTHVPEGLLDAHLLEMLGAPMNKFAQDLEGTGLALLLADSRGQILQRWTEDRQALSHLDQVGTVRGAVLAENVVGTNGVGTVAATGTAVQIRGTEHFAEIYQSAVCTGSPVLHPVTRKLLAVVTISCDMTPRSDLLKPLVKSMTTQLEQHLMTVEQPNSRELFNTFLDLSRRQQSPIVAFGPQGIIIQSTLANSLSSQDLTLLKQLGDEGRPSGKYLVELTDGTVELELKLVGQGNSVVSIGPRASRRSANAPNQLSSRIIGRAPEWLETVKLLDKFRSNNGVIVLAGESGVGKTSLALRTPHKLSGDAVSRKLIDAAERHIVGTREWLGRLDERLDSSEELTVRGIETLDAPAIDGMAALIAARSRTASVILTLTTQSIEDLELFERKFDAAGVYVPPLRDRSSDIPALWKFFNELFSSNSRLELSDEALVLMRSYAWPGNVKELRQLANQLIGSGKNGVVLPKDLPVHMQSIKSMTVIERMELEAIRKALQEADGNRVKAADILGISRATVYRKIKAYRLDER